MNAAALKCAANGRSRRNPTSKHIIPSIGHPDCLPIHPSSNPYKQLPIHLAVDPHSIHPVHLVVLPSHSPFHPLLSPTISPNLSHLLTMWVVKDCFLEFQKASTNILLYLMATGQTVAPKSNAPRLNITVYSLLTHVPSGNTNSGVLSF